MTKLTIFLIIFLAIGCTDNKKIIEQSKAMHQDSARLDSINYATKSQANEKLNGIILNGRFYNTSQLDSIFTGAK